LELCQVHEERRWDYPTSDLLINFVPDSRRFPKGLFGVPFFYTIVLGPYLKTRGYVHLKHPFLPLSQGRYLCLFTQVNHDSLVKLRKPCHSRTMRMPRVVVSFGND
jgi:hypothetical protein